MSKIEPFGYTLFCDDVREEVGSKLSYMGVYSDTLNVHSDGPAILPKLAIAMTFIVPGGLEINELEFFVRQRIGDEEADLVRLQPPDPIAPAAEGNFAKIAFTFQLAPFRIEQNALLRARVVFNGQEYKLGSLEVRLMRPDEIPAAAGLS